MGSKYTRFLMLAATIFFVLPLAACSNDTSNFPSEGSVANPVDIGLSPTAASGTVGAGGNSYFMTSAEPGDWLISVSNIDGTPDLYIYNDAAFSSLVCLSENPGTEPDDCTITCGSACDIFIRISGSQTTGASFTLSVIENVAPAAARDRP